MTARTQSAVAEGMRPRGGAFRRLRLRRARHDVQPSDDSQRLLSFLRLIALAAAALGAGYLAVATVLGSWELYVTGGVTAALAATLTASARLARHGRLSAAVRIASYALLGAVVVVAPWVAFAYATLVVTCTLAATIGIAFAEPERARTVLHTSMAVALYVAFIGLWFGHHTPLPIWAENVLVASTLVAQIYLICHAMLQLRDRFTGMLRAEATASQKLTEAHRTLEAAYDRVRAADRKKDEFIAVLGHELRNPLSPIALALELMRDSCQGSAVRERAIIERQVLHMTRLVDDLLDASRITTGKLTLRRQAVDIRTVAKESVQMTEPLLGDRQQTLTVDLPKRALLVDADPMRLAQVVSNLLSNAAKYTPPMGHIALRAERADNSARIVVQDDGIGMTSELLARIFEPFVQGDRPQGGLGLGLTLARDLVEMHGGQLEAESEGPGRGSRFTVTLPLSARQAEPVQPPVFARKTRSLRVLVVDDNHDAAELLALALSRHGFEVRVAHDGPSALRIVSDFAPEFAVLDLGLPVMDGYELAARMREKLRDHPPKLVALTGYGQPADRERTAKAGFSAHLVKPVSLEQLENCLA